MANDQKSKESSQTANRPERKKNLKGEYELPGDSSPSRNEARREFLRAIRLQVLPSLKEGAFKEYEVIFETLADCLRGKYFLREISSSSPYRFWKLFEALAKEHPRLLPLHDAIISWAESYSLLYRTSGQYAVWFLDQTLHTLNCWHLYSWYKDNLEWEYFSLTIAPQATTVRNPPFKFVHPPWDCFEVSRAHYKHRIRHVFERYLNDYLDSVENVARKHGLIKPKQKREGGGRWSKFHLDWFVQYQLEEKEPEDIAALYSYGEKPSDTPTHSAVWSAICETALLIGLEPRPAKSGRGRKRKKIARADR